MRIGVPKEIKPQENSIAAFNEIFPPHKVATQLKNLIPVGTAINAVAIVKNKRIHGNVLAFELDQPLALPPFID